MTPKQERFIAEYCIDLNGTQAAIRAGCSPRSANRTASKWLSKADISREIAQRTNQQLEAAQLSAVRTLEELRRVAFSDIGRFFDARGNLKRLDKLAPEDRAAIASIEVVLKKTATGDGKVERVLKIRRDKLHALEMAMQHFKRLQPKTDEPPVQKVSVRVKTLATILDEQQLQLIRERLLEYSQSGTVSKPEAEQDSRTLGSSQ